VAISRHDHRRVAWSGINTLPAPDTITVSAIFKTMSTAPGGDTSPHWAEDIHRHLRTVLELPMKSTERINKRSVASPIRHSDGPSLLAETVKQEATARSVSVSRYLRTFRTGTHQACTTSIENGWSAPRKLDVALTPPPSTFSIARPISRA